MDGRKKLGLALCGSYCTYEKLFEAARPLAEEYELYPIMSDTAAETDTRFGMATANIRALTELCGGRSAVTTIAEAEPLGPSLGLDEQQVPQSGLRRRCHFPGVACGRLPPVTVADEPSRRYG